MGEITKIEWCQATWNPWYGCHKVSAGCKNCYMFRDMPHYGRDPNAVVRSKTTFDAPLKWAKSGKVASGARVFTCSWSDWFIAEADPWRAEAWDIIRRTPQYTYLILTKRPERILANLPKLPLVLPNARSYEWPYPNVWLGVSAENQEQANKRIPQLLDIPAAVRFVSAEPLLSPIRFSEVPGLNRIGQGPGIQWVITGGESHPSAPRPCNLDWVRTIRDQCQAASVAFFHKQHGGSRKVEGTWGGRELDGQIWNEFPVVAP